MTEYATHVPLPSKTRDALVGELNVQLANTFDLYSQAKYAHWNVKGPHFFDRHELFDRVANNLRLAVDDLAERIGALGGVARGTARTAAEASQLPEYPLDAVQGRAHTRALIDRLGVWSASMRRALTAAEEAGDPITADLYTEVVRTLEKDLYFLQSHHQGQQDG